MRLSDYVIKYNLPHRVKDFDLEVEVPRRRLDLSGDLALVHEDCKKLEGLKAALKKCVLPRGSVAEFDTCSVYAIGAENFGHTKVGITCNPLPRIRQLQTSNFATLRIHALLWFDTWEAAEEVEKLVFRAASEMNIKGRGEWLVASPKDAFALVLKAARYAGHPCRDSGRHFEDLVSGFSIVDRLRHYE